MKKRAKARRSSSWRNEWEPIFGASREGRLPDRFLGVTEVAEGSRAMRQSKVLPCSGQPGKGN
jgi:hypothetical protein